MDGRIAHDIVQVLTRICWRTEHVRCWMLGLHVASVPMLNRERRRADELDPGMDGSEATITATALNLRA